MSDGRVDNSLIMSIQMHSHHHHHRHHPNGVETDDHTGDIGMDVLGQKETHSWTVEVEGHTSPTPLLVSAQRAQSYSRSPSTDVAYRPARPVSSVQHQREDGLSTEEPRVSFDDSHEVAGGASWLRRRRGQRHQALKARVRFNYIKRNPGELSLHVGEVVDVTDNSDFDWWIGTLPSGKSGMFPSNCCILETSAEDTGTTDKRDKHVERSASVWRSKFRSWVLRQKWDTRMHVFPRTLFYLFICSVCI